MQVIIGFRLGDGGHCLKEYATSKTHCVIQTRRSNIAHKNYSEKQKIKFYQLQFGVGKMPDSMDHCQRCLQNYIPRNNWENNPTINLFVTSRVSDIKTFAGIASMWESKELIPAKQWWKKM